MFIRQALMRSCLLLIASIGVGSVVCAAEPLEIELRDNKGMIVANRHAESLQDGGRRDEIHAV